MKNLISDNNNGYKELGMWALYFPMIISLSMCIAAISGILYDYNFFLKKMFFIILSTVIFGTIFYYFYYFQNNTIKEIEISNECIVITFFRKKIIIFNQDITCLKKSNYMFFSEYINLKTKKGVFKIIKEQFKKYDEIYCFLTEIVKKQ